MATQKEEYYTDLLETMIKHNYFSKTPLSKEKLLQGINTIVAETEDKERNINNGTTETLIRPPVTTNAPREKTDIANERQFYSEIWTLQSTINDSADDHSNKNVAERDPETDPLVATHTSDGKERKITDTDTTKGNYPHKLLTNREIQAFIAGVIPPIHQTTVDGVATSGWILHAVHAFL